MGGPAGRAGSRGDEKPFSEFRASLDTRSRETGFLRLFRPALRAGPPENQATARIASTSCSRLIRQRPSIFSRFAIS